MLCDSTTLHECQLREQEYLISQSIAELLPGSNPARTPTSAMPKQAEDRYVCLLSQTTNEARLRLSTYWSLSPRSSQIFPGTVITFLPLLCRISIYLSRPRNDHKFLFPQRSPILCLPLTLAPFPPLQPPMYRMPVGSETRPVDGRPSSQTNPTSEPRPILTLLPFATAKLSTVEQSSSEIPRFLYSVHYR
jgi:hypothetical protein